MRSNQRDLQDVWFCTVGTETIGIDTEKVYSKPEKREFVVSTTNGDPINLGSGMVPEYDRYITSYDRDFAPEEGMMVFVDVVPALDEGGNLLRQVNALGISEDYITVPDYILKKIFDTQRGNIARYGLKKV